MNDDHHSRQSYTVVVLSSFCSYFKTVSRLHNRLYSRFYANEPSQAALERSSQDAYDVIRLKFL